MRLGERAFLQLEYPMEGRDFSVAGTAASQIKKMLTEVGFEPETIRRATVVAYEAAMNIVIHAFRGRLLVHIEPDGIGLTAIDEGPGIPDVAMAMQEGYSTASASIREMGFGAGMGLPNIKRHADGMAIETKVGEGTTLKAWINCKRG